MRKITYSSIGDFRQAYGARPEEEWSLGRGHRDDTALFIDGAMCENEAADISVALARDVGVLFACNNATGAVGVLGRHHTRLEGPAFLSGLTSHPIQVHHITDTHQGGGFIHYLSSFRSGFWKCSPEKFDSPRMRSFYAEYGNPASELAFGDIHNDLGLFGLESAHTLRVAYNPCSTLLYAHEPVTDQVEILGALPGLDGIALDEVRGHHFQDWLHQYGPRPVSWFKGRLLYLSDLAVVYEDIDEAISDLGGTAEDLCQMPYRIMLEAYIGIAGDREGSGAVMCRMEDSGDFFVRVGAEGPLAYLGRIDPERLPNESADSLFGRRNQALSDTWVMSKIAMFGGADNAGTGL